MIMHQTIMYLAIVFPINSVQPQFCQDLNSSEEISDSFVEKLTNDRQLSGDDPAQSF